MVVYCGGPSCSGTRMLFDAVRALGFEAVHASLPGYHDNPDRSPGQPHLDVAHPVWWTPDEMEAKFGPGRWVIITREPEFAAQSAVRGSFVASVDDYPAFRGQADEVLDAIEGAYRLTYEDFVADPQGEYDQLADWLGVSHREISGIYDGNAAYSKPEEPAEPARPKRRRRYYQ